MSNPTAVSDLERAEHLGYGESKGVKRVSVFNDGVQVNAATEDKQNPLSAYQSAGMDITANPYYFGYLKTDGSWYIKKLDTTSGTIYVKGDSDYATNWTGRAELTYGEFNDIF
jgi:hypothetical protein